MPCLIHVHLMTDTVNLESFIFRIQEAWCIFNLNRYVNHVLTVSDTYVLKWFVSFFSDRYVLTWFCLGFSDKV